MTNLIDYLESAQPSFDDRPFSDIDSAALAAFCMVDVELAGRALPERPGFFQKAARMLVPSAFGACFADCLRSERFDGMFFGPNPEKTKRVLYGLASSPRFRGLRLGDGQTAFDRDAHLQFAAMTFTLPGRFCYVGFRGTDRTVTGWREDFDMALRDETPAQAAAARYLEAAASVHREPLYVGGHSKGGNLALVAATKASPRTRSRILAVYSHDGPGLRPGTYDEAAFRSLEGRVRKTVPQDSLVGLIFESEERCRGVLSTAKGLEEHDLTTWAVDLEAEGGPDFVNAKVNDAARRFAAALNSWVETAPREEIEAVVDVLFEVLEDPKTRAQFPEAFSDPRVIAAFFKAAADGGNETARKALRRALGHFAASAASAIGGTLLGKQGRPAAARRPPAARTGGTVPPNALD